MAKKSQDEPQLNAQQLLEARVDAMMDPETKAKLADATNAPGGAPTLPAKKATAEPPKPEASVAPAPAEVAVTQPVSAAVSTADDVEVKPLTIDTLQSDAAIDDIVAQEADEVLAAEDAGIANSQLLTEVEAEETKQRRHPVFWFFVTLVAAVLLILGLMLVNPNLVPSFAP